MTPPTRAVDELAMLDVAGTTFHRDGVLAGALTPVFFGSAVNNFGVQNLLDSFLKHSVPPATRTAGGIRLRADHPRFSGFIFKIQANLDPKHRDRIAFLRVCTGTFTREMTVTHAQTGRRVRLSNSHKLFGRERETVDLGYPGDVIGLVSHSEFRVGDTLSEDPTIIYDEIPRFAPEYFAYLHATSPADAKRLREGLDQLLQEGVIQSFQVDASVERAALLGAVGPLQFEVVQHRLKCEYGAESRLAPAPWDLLRWVKVIGIDSETLLTDTILPSGVRIGRDSVGGRIVLFPKRVGAELFHAAKPPIVLLEAPQAAARANDLATV